MLAGRKLLIADNSRTIQKVVELTFADEGVTVVSVSDGQEAIERIEEVGPDIILAEALMPWRSGYEVCEYTKQNAKFKHIPVMLLVGSFEPFDEAEARRVGADDILTKPFQSIRRLMDKVGDLVSPKPASAEPQPPPTESQPGWAEAQPVKADERIAEHPQVQEPAAGFLEEDVPTAELPKSEEPVTGKRLSTAELEVTTADTRPLPAGESVANYVASAPANSPKPRQEATTETWESRNMERTAIESQNKSYLDTGDVLLDLDNGGPIGGASSDDFVLDLDLDEVFEAQAVPSSSVSAPGFHPELQTSERSWQGQHDEQRTESAHSFTSEATYRSGEFVESSASTKSSLAESTTPQREGGMHQQPASHAVSEESQAGVRPAQPESLRDEPSAAMGAARSGGLITLDQLSPEVIDAIARRAVAQLSEKAVQEIAWEVVPQLAELLIKRKLEEKESKPN